MYWQRKGAATTQGPRAYLLRLQALHLQFFRYVPLHDYISGTGNKLADLLSRAWTLTDTALVAHFNTSYPQDKPWRLCRLHTPMNFGLISALSKRRCDPASLMHTPKGRIPTGLTGMNSAYLSNLTPSSTTPLIRSPTSCRSLRLDTTMGDSPPAVNASDLTQYRTPCAQWATLALTTSCVGRLVGKSNLIKDEGTKPHFFGIYNPSPK